jgi:hypothetical protein
MKEYKFSAATKRYTRKQLTISLLMTLSFIVTTIGLFIQQNLFYARLLLVLSLVSLFIAIMIIRKVRIIEDINYLTLHKDRFEINNNINVKGKTFRFNDIKDVRFTMKGIKFRVGMREYRISFAFLEEKQIQEVKKVFERY